MSSGDAAARPLAFAEVWETPERAPVAQSPRKAVLRRDDPDSDALALVASGDVQRGFHLLMQRHGTAVYRRCRHMLADDILAEDVVQQVFAEAYRDLPRFAPGALVRTWLFAIANHRVLDALKARRRGSRRFVDVSHAIDQAAESSTETEFDTRRIKAHLEDALSTLEPHTRSAVVGRYLYGLTFAELAACSNEDPRTLQARVARALPKLRSVLVRAGIQR